jgi:hypothetical protein
VEILLECHLNLTQGQLVLECQTLLWHPLFLSEDVYMWPVYPFSSSMYGFVFICSSRSILKFICRKINKIAKMVVSVCLYAYLIFKIIHTSQIRGNTLLNCTNTHGPYKRRATTTHLHRSMVSKILFYIRIVTKSNVQGRVLNNIYVDTRKFTKDVSTCRDRPICMQEYFPD